MNRRVTGFAALAVAAQVACFYTDRINVPPVARLEPMDVQSIYFRGDSMRFTSAASSDDDGDRLHHRFSAEACFATGNVVDTICSSLSFEKADPLEVFVIRIPRTVPGEQDVPVNQIRARVVVDDDRSESEATQTWHIGNAAPSILLQANSAAAGSGSSFPIGVPIDISAVVDDRDDDPDDAVLEWSVTSSPQESTADFEFYELAGAQVTSPTYRLLPDASGEWVITVKASDPLGATSLAHSALSIGGDMPPCLGATNRSTSFKQLIDASATPVDFAVLQVLDEFNPYPANEYGVASFNWFLREVGAGSFVSVGGDAASFALDPSLYLPGDEIELRVEVDDGEHFPSCPGSQSKCSIGADDCFQRDTWSIEIR